MAIAEFKVSDRGHGLPAGGTTPMEPEKGGTVEIADLGHSFHRAGGPGRSFASLTSEPPSRTPRYNWRRLLPLTNPIWREDKPLIVDDHLLLRSCFEDEPPELRPDGGRIFTTGLWCHRLAGPSVDRSVPGPFSSALGGADPTLATAAIEAVTLSRSRSTSSLRQLAWPMGAWSMTASGST